MKAIYKKNRKKLIKSWKPVVFFTILFFIFSFENEKIELEKMEFKTDSLSEVLVEASNSNKLVFFYAYSSWSSSHKKMMRKTFSNSNLINSYEETFIRFKLDMEEGEKAERLISKYHIDQSPTFLFLDEKGKVLLKTVGYKSSSELMKLAKNLKKKKF